MKRITDPSFVYRPASSHSDPAAFRARMQKRMRERQAAKQPTVVPIRKEASK